MSLSQKHSGKVLVPWFNIAEWKLVHNLIYYENSQDWPRALTILKIWKHRTPLLSAGVEGTLIVLEALLVNTTQLSSYEIGHIFSTSLVRFLNLCAANNDKQGTFYKTAMKNELPKWLVSVRHEIAHSHKVPSESMLILSLQFCLEWLKGKYWDVQCENMTDFIVQRADDSIVDDAIYVYQHLGDKVQSNKALKRSIHRFITDKKNQFGNEEIIKSVNTVLKEFIKSNKEDSSNKICKLLVDNCLILSTELELDEEGLKKIPSNFLNKWNNVLNIIHETQIMSNFISKLFDFTSDENRDLTYREMASFWINEIFVGLNNQENVESGLHFISNNNYMKNKDFARKVIEMPNPFTMNFVQEMLRYNTAPSQFIDDSLALIRAFNGDSVPTNPSSDQIYTVDDLNFDVECPSPVETTKEDTHQSKSRWTLIEDISPYMNLPLGILPHQDRNINPLLDLF